MAQIASMQLETTPPSADALRTLWLGPLDFPKSEPNSDALNPALGDDYETKAPYRAKACLPRDYPPMMTLR